MRRICGSTTSTGAKADSVWTVVAALEGPLFHSSPAPSGVLSAIASTTLIERFSGVGVVAVWSETSPNAGEDQSNESHCQNYGGELHRDSLRLVCWLKMPDRPAYRDQMEVIDSRAVKQNRTQYYPTPAEPHPCLWAAFGKRQCPAPYCEQIRS